MITLKEYLTSSGKYPDRLTSKELTAELLSNASELLSKVRLMLTEIGYQAPLEVSSGFRPSTVNKAIATASKTSLHQTCLAIDLMDDRQQSLGKLLASKPAMLKKYGLFIEDLDSTKGKLTNWVHLDASPTRTDRPTRMFKP